jgi:hypothetical protein
MAYTHTSHTSSGWQISTDPSADPDKRWRAEHPKFGVRFFDARHKILEYTVKHMTKQFAALVDKPGAKPKSWSAAMCLCCGGKWLVPGNPDPRTLEGTCLDCQAESDTEKPLQFFYLVSPDARLSPVLPELPKTWLTK